MAQVFVVMVRKNTTTQTRRASLAKRQKGIIISVFVNFRTVLYRVCVHPSFTSTSTLFNLQSSMTCPFTVYCLLFTVYCANAKKYISSALPGRFCQGYRPCSKNRCGSTT